MDYENFLNLVKMRRRIRNFIPDPIVDEYVEKIIEAARWAPSGGNYQPWEFIIIKNKDVKDKIVNIIMEHSCGDPRTKEAYPLLTMITRGDSHFTSSLPNAFLYMALAATTLGLGSQRVSATGRPYVKCLLKELLGIPERIDIYDMMALSYPAQKPADKIVRSINDIIHYERFDKTKYRTDQEIKEFIIRLRKGK